MSETIQTQADTSAPGGDDLASVIGAAYDAVATSDGPTRDERGRFSRSVEPDTAPEPAEVTDQPEVKAEDETPPPQSWSADEWSQIPANVRQRIAEREAEISRLSTERANEAKDTSPLREVLAPYQAKHAAMGITAHEAVRRLLAAQDALETDPDRAFPELARAFGYDLNRLFQHAQPQHTQEFRDPRVDQLLSQMQQREHATIQQQIDAFAADPAHSHFSDVRQTMGILMQGNPSLTLKDAYDQAVWANPSVRAKVLAAERAREQEAARKAATSKVEQAKRAGSSVRDSAPGSGSLPTKPAATLQEEIARAIEQLSAA